MATYKEIFGTNIEVLASDPANPVTGQVWYNSTDNVVKGAAATTAGAWATGGSLNQARSDLFGSNGTQTAALTVGGYIQPTGTYIANTEAYDGSAWTELNDLNVAKSSGVLSGIQTSGLYTGADSGPVGNLTTNESWNGTSWTEVGDLNTGRRYLGGTAADNTAALVFGGTGGGAITESWNGTSWTEVNDLNTARTQQAGVGIQTAALSVGGRVDTGAPVEEFAGVEEWNGTSWTEVGDLNTARQDLASSGTVNSALAYGGSGSPGAVTETWNGTSWTEDSDLNTPRNELQGAGTSSSSALASGGGQPDTTATEEWTGAGSPLTVTFTDS